jgi:hypothetical protein
LSKERIMAERLVELSISPETVFFILEKVREFDEKVEQTDPDSGSNPSDDLNVDVLEEMADDPTLDELSAAVDALNDDEQTDLVALMWLGRGDFGPGEWAEGRQLASERRTAPLIHYLAGTPRASDYLEEGLSLLGFVMTESDTGRRA